MQDGASASRANHANAGHGVIFTRALGFPFFGEVPTLTQTLGSILVIGSGVMLSFGEAAVARFRRRALGTGRGAG